MGRSETLYAQPSGPSRRISRKAGYPCTNNQSGTYSGAAGSASPEQYLWGGKIWGKHWSMHCPHPTFVEQGYDSVVMYSTLRRVFIIYLRIITRVGARRGPVQRRLRRIPAARVQVGVYGSCTQVAPLRTSWQPAPRATRSGLRTRSTNSTFSASYRVRSQASRAPDLTILRARETDATVDTDQHASANAEPTVESDDEDDVGPMPMPAGADGPAAAKKRRGAYSLLSVPPA